MWRTYRVGRLLGFPIEVNPSFLLLLGLVLMFSGGLTGLYVVLLGFASVLLHELGHAVVARRLGVRIAGIELRFFGGAAKMIDAPRTPGDEIAIADRVDAGKRLGRVAGADRGERTEDFGARVDVINESRELVPAVFDQRPNNGSHQERAVNQDLHLTAANRTYL